MTGRNVMGSCVMIGVALIEKTQSIEEFTYAVPRTWFPERCCQLTMMQVFGCRYSRAIKFRF